MPRSRKPGGGKYPGQEGIWNASEQLMGDPAEYGLAEDAVLLGTAFVGTDVHKDVCASIMDAGGNGSAGGGIRNAWDDVRSALEGLPGDARPVTESPSAWEDMSFQLRDSRGYDVTPLTRTPRI